MIGHHRVLALIPARGGSKGVPGKNILPIGGRPLIAWTVAAALESRHIDRLVLSSDDDRIIEAAQAAGCEVPFRRDAALATDEASSIDVVLDALERLPDYDIIVLLQPTSPLRVAGDIDGVLQRLDATGAPSCVSIRPAEDHPYLSFKVGASERLEHFVAPPAGASFRRQDLPAAWCLNGAVYAAHTEWFRRERTFLSPLTVGYPMPADRSLDIDTPADIEQLKQIVEPSRSASITKL
jgi:CMP-N,N'-diacetyllegionaminic acid synthase